MSKSYFCALMALENKELYQNVELHDKNAGRASLVMAIQMACSLTTRSAFTDHLMHLQK